MKKKIQREELFKMLNGFKKVENLPGESLAWAIMRNKKAIEAELREVQKIVQLTPEIEKYENGRIAICKKYCEKNEKGGAVIKNGKYAGLDENPEFEKAIDEYKKENQKVVNLIDQTQKNYEKAIKEEIEFDFYTVKKDNLPQNITPAQLEVISIFVEEPPELKVV